MEVCCGKGAHLFLLIFQADGALIRRVSEHIYTRFMSSKQFYSNLYAQSVFPRIRQRRAVLKPSKKTHKTVRS